MAHPLAYYSRELITITGSFILQAELVYLVCVCVWERERERKRERGREGEREREKEREKEREGERVCLYVWVYVYVGVYVCLYVCVGVCVCMHHQLFEDSTKTELKFGQVPLKRLFQPQDVITD